MAKHHHPPRPPLLGTRPEITCHCGDADCDTCAASWEYDDHEDYR